MKYYYPTSTLNFDAIASSQCLAPTSFYCEKSIGFSRYERTVVDISDDYLVFYPYPVLWSVSKSDSLDYPMLVEVDDESGLLDHGERFALQTGSCGIRRSRPYYFMPVDILSKRIRFLFRTQEELWQIVNRAQSSVAEYKLSGVSEAWNVDNFALIGSAPEATTIKAATPMGDASDLPVSSWDSAWTEYVKRDRLDGAAAGFRAGCWLHAQRSGRFIDTMRGALTFEVWREMLSPELNALLDMICNSTSLRWDVNRKAVVDFCAVCWNNCFAETHDETRHQILRSIAKSVADTTYVYPIRDIEDSEMQALACFILSGKRDATLVNLIKTQNVRLPELVLALHGALVGYSVLSRSLFEKRSYVAESDLAEEFGEEENCRANIPNKTHEPRTVEEKVPAVAEKSQGAVDVICAETELPVWAKRVVDIARKVISGLKNLSQKKRAALNSAMLQSLAECVNESELIQQLSKKHKEEGWGPNTKAFKELKKAIVLTSEDDLFARSSRGDAAPLSVAMSTERESALLIDDRNLVNGLKNFLLMQKGFREEDRVQILKDAEFLQREYAPSGRYARDEEKNPRDNARTIQHLINLINKKVPLSTDERASLYLYLSQRYAQKGK